MPLFARHAFFGMTAIALSCVALSGCVPSNAAMGDTQSPDTAVAHSMEDRDSLSIAMIGSDDVTADSMASRCTLPSQAQWTRNPPRSKACVTWCNARPTSLSSQEST